MASQYVAKSWGAAALAGDRASAKRRLQPPAASAGSIREQYPDTGGQENRPSPPLGSGLYLIGMCPWCGESLHPGRKCHNEAEAFDIQGER